MTEPGTTDVYIDPLAHVATSTQLGSGTKVVWTFTRVAEGATVGAHCQFEQNVYVEWHVRIGNRVKVQNNVSMLTLTVLSNGGKTVCQG